MKMPRPLREAWGTPVQMLPIGPHVGPHLPGTGGTAGVTAEAPAEDVEALLERLQRHIFKRRIRVKDLFQDFDPLRSGRCTQQQFMRAVNQLVPDFHESEVSLLVANYTDEGPHVYKPQVVNYATFVRAVDEVFTLAELEKQPTVRVPRPGASLNMGSLRPLTLAADYDMRLQQILRRMAILTKTRGITFKSCFQDCERSDATSLMCPRRGGKVTPAQFKQHFPFSKDFCESDLQFVMRKYVTDGGDIHFHALDNDIANVELEPPKTLAPTFSARARTAEGKRTQRSLPEGEASASEDLIEKLRGHVAERRLQLNGMFHDFDKHRKGVCTVGQVNTVFTVLRIQLSDKELDCLSSMFGDGAGGFLYRNFISAVTQAPALPAPTSARAVSLASPSSRRQHHSLQSEAQLEEIETMVAKRIRMSKLSLKDLFQDFDRTRSGRVTRSQFLRIMDVMECKLTDHQAKLLLQTYCDFDQEEQSTSRFAYLDFCASVAKMEQYASDRSMPYSARTGQPSKYFNLRGQVMPLDVRGNMLPRPLTR